MTEFIKWLLEWVERLMMAVLFTVSSFGMFLSGCLALYCIRGGDALTLRNEMPILLGSMVVVTLAMRLLTFVRYKRLEILADELEDETEESRKLFEHLEVR